MSEVNEIVSSVRESISPVFRHILPGVLILSVSSLSMPAWIGMIDFTETLTLIILALIAMVAGNAWYVFHRYFILQLIDYLFYLFDRKGQPIKSGQNGYRTDLAKHVSNFFRTLPKQKIMARHIRDRFSHFNFMFIVSEVIFFFAIISEDNTLMNKHKILVIVFSIIGFLAAIWQYSIVRLIDAEFVQLNNSDSN